MKKFNKKEKVDMQKVADELAKEIEKYFEKHPVQTYNYVINSEPTPGPKCCQGCPNNPKNNPNASGFYNCALPAQELFRW